MNQSVSFHPFTWKEFCFVRNDKFFCIAKACVFFWGSNKKPTKAVLPRVIFFFNSYKKQSTCCFQDSFQLFSYIIDRRDEKSRWCVFIHINCSCHRQQAMLWVVLLWKLSPLCKCHSVLAHVQPHIVLLINKNKKLCAQKICLTFLEQLYLEICRILCCEDFWTQRWELLFWNIKTEDWGGLSKII